ncbi:MAG: hydroxymethylbilane synthase [Parvicellaceae bacterium]
MSETLVIGSRGSDLALWQANHVKMQLQDLGFNSSIKIIKTKGDKIQHLSFDKLEGKGFFTKEIEDALLDNSIDIAVHSHKDLETNPPKGLVIAAVSPREDPSELLLINKNAYDPSKFWGLKQNGVIGTSSSRRKSQLLLFREDLNVKDLRGNVPTRIQKLRDGHYDAIVLAKAGVSRLKLDVSDLNVQTLPRKWFVPAPAQGVLGLQIRENDQKTHAILSKINSLATQQEIKLERKILNLFNGGCQLPLGVYCEQDVLTSKVWVSILKDGSSSPLRLYKENCSAEEIVELIQRPITDKKQVFISRYLNDQSLFKKALEGQNIKVEGKSFIEVVFNNVNELPAADWVFFTSSNAVESLSNQVDQLRGKKIGAFGKATAFGLEKLGLIVDFIGNGLPNQIAIDFAEVARNEKVLFPISNRSLKTIQQQIPKNNQIELITYTIKDVENQITDFDIFVFTSPSNVHSFFKTNELAKNKAVIAIGPSTKAVLESYDVKNVMLPWEASELALSDAVFSYLYS